MGSLLLLVVVIFPVTLLGQSLPVGRSDASFYASYGSWSSPGATGGVLSIHRSLLPDVDLSLQFRNEHSGKLQGGLLIGHSVAREEWITIARAGVLARQGINGALAFTAETGAQIRLTNWLAAGFLAFADLDTRGIMVGNRWVLSVGRW